MKLPRHALLIAGTGTVDCRSLTAVAESRTVSGELGVSLGSRRVARRPWLPLMPMSFRPACAGGSISSIPISGQRALRSSRRRCGLLRRGFGQFLHHEPEPTMSPDQAAANRSDGLLITLQRARQDEHCGPHALLLLFRVDQEVQLQGCRRYHVNCGGREQCYDASQSGLVCLRPLAEAPLLVRGQGTLWPRERGIHRPPYGGRGWLRRWRRVTELRALSLHRDSVVVQLVITAVVLFLLLVASLQRGRVVARRGERQRSRRGQDQASAEQDCAGSCRSGHKRANYLNANGSRCVPTRRF